MRKKSKIALLVLAVVTVIYAIASYRAIQEYDAWKHQKFLEWCTANGFSPDSWYANFAPDYAPFWKSSFGKPYLIVGIALALSWIFVPSLTSLLSRDKNPLAAFFLGALIGISILIVPVYSSTETVYIDVLAVCDEEFDSGITWVHSPPLGPKPVPSKHWAELAMEDITEYFSTTFNIIFRWHYWLTFESYDGTSNMESILNEAISQIGWYWGMRYDDADMELLAVFTQQYTDAYGLSLPWKRAFIVEADYYIHKIMFHEIGHQFSLEHCQYSYCAMTTNYPPGTGYCELHCAIIMANRDILLQPPPPPRDDGDGGHGGSGRNAVLV